MFTANTDLDEAMSVREAINSDIISRDSENEEIMCSPKINVANFNMSR